MNMPSSSFGFGPPIVDPLNAAAQRALDALQGIYLALAMPQPHERTTQLQAAARELQGLICKLVQLIEPAASPISLGPVSSGRGGMQ